MINTLLQNLKEALEKDDFQKIDTILEETYTDQTMQNEIEKIDDILQEATLYIEFKEEDYKNEALKLIDNYK